MEERCPENFRLPTVLAVEDDENDFFFLQHECVRTGVRVNFQRICTPQLAIEYLKGEGAYRNRVQHAFPAIVLIDLKLGRESGFEVLKWIRQQPELDGLIVWILSGSLQAIDASKAYQLGANSYVVKPHTPAAWTQLAKSLNLEVSSAKPNLLHPFHQSS
jgi:CheY-like chemotaxis protein